MEKEIKVPFLQLAISPCGTCSWQIVHDAANARIDGEGGFFFVNTPLTQEALLDAYFAERDRWFRCIVTDSVMLHGYGLILT